MARQAPFAVETARNPGWRSSLRILTAVLAGLCATGWGQAARAQTGRSEVASVAFEGNSFFSDAELGRLVRTRAPSCPPILVVTCALGVDWGRSSTPFSVRTLAEDARRLQFYYQANGFQDAAVATEAAITADSAMAVTFRIVEGSAYRVGSISFVGDPVPTELGAGGGLPIGAGDFLQSLVIQEAADTLARRLRDAGYAYADVFINIDLPFASDTASVAYRVELGPMSTFGPVEVYGNRLLEDEVILARLPFREGQVFSERGILEGQRSLYELGLVTRALVERDNTRAEADSVIPILVQIEEGELHVVGAEGGFDNSECVNVEGRWASRNFLGGGRTLRVRTRLSNILAGILRETPFCPQAGAGEFGRLNWLASADFNQPNLFTPRMTLAAALYSERLSRNNIFVRETFGLDVAVTRSIAGGSVANLRFRPQFNRLNAAEVTLCATFLACTPTDIEVLSSFTWLAPVGLSFSMDRTEDIFNPRRGYRLLVDLEYASGFTASDYAYLRVFADGSTYLDIGSDAVLALRLRAGRIRAGGFAGGLSGEGRFADIVPPQKRFYGGGANSVRGFAQNTLGPRTLSIGVEELLVRRGPSAEPACAPEEVVSLGCDGAVLAGSNHYQLRPIGGLATLEASAEVRFRLHRDELEGVAFVDAGQVWPRELGLEDLQVSPGIGIRYNTLLGPIRLDVAYSFREQEPLQVVTSQIRPFAPGRDDPDDRIDIGPRGGPREPIDWVVSEDLAILRPPVLFGVDPGFSWRRLHLHFSIGHAF